MYAIISQHATFVHIADMLDEIKSYCRRFDEILGY